MSAARVPGWLGGARGRALLALGVVAGLAALATCKTRSPGSAGGVVGTAGAKAVIAAMRAAEQVRAPWRCARLRARPSAAGPVDPLGPSTVAPADVAPGTPSPPADPSAGPPAGPIADPPAGPPAGPIDTFDAGRTWTVDGDVLRARSAGDGLRLGIVADARGGSDATRAALMRLQTLFTQARVDVVAAVGGMGTTEAELVQALEPLTRGAWPVIAIPGDRESWPALRRAVARLRSTGAAIVDGATVRFIEAGGAVAATLPGMPYRERLAAGDDGCAHDDTDVAALLQALASRRGPRIVLTPRAPRTAGDDSSDLVSGGLHAGDVALGRALARDPVDLVVHGQLADRIVKPGRATRGPVVMSAGSVDLAPHFDEVGARIPPQALVVSVDRRGALTWQPLAVVPGT